LLLWAGGEKIQDGGVEAIRGLHVDHVPDARQDDQTGLGNAVPQHLRNRVKIGQVEFAHHHQRGHRDPVQPLSGRWIEGTNAIAFDPMSPARVVPNHLPQARPYRRVSQRRGKQGIGQPAFARRLIAASSPRRFHLGDRFTKISPRKSAQRRIGEDQGSGRLRMGQRKIDRDPSSPRQPQDVSWGHIEVTHESHQVVGRGMLTRRQSRPAVAAHVVAENTILLREHLKLVVPHAGIETLAMDEHQRVPSPGGLVVQPRTVDLGQATVSRHGPSPFRRAI
jgi:hypothetical protein